MAVPAIPEAGKPWLDWAQGVDAEARKVTAKADGTDPRLTDTRTPTDGTVTNAKVAANAAISADKLADGATGKVLTAAERTKLAGVATGATANSADATLLARANHTGTQSADTIVDGTTNHAFTAADDTKLAGVATAATANSPDATLLARANHTGTQAAATITGLATVATSGAYADLLGRPNSPWFDIRDYGADPTGATTSTTAIQAALNAAGANQPDAQGFGGGVVYIPAGTFNTGQLSIPARVAIVGESRRSRLRLANGTNTHLLVTASSTSNEIVLERLTLDGNKANNTAGDAVHFNLTTDSATQAAAGALGQNDANLRFNDVYAVNFAGNGFYLFGRGENRISNCYAWGCNGYGWRIHVFDSVFTACASGMSGLHGWYDDLGQNALIGCKAWYSGMVDKAQADGFYLFNGCVRTRLVGCEAQDNYGNGFSLVNASNNTLTGCISEANNKDQTTSGVSGARSGYFLSNASYNVIDGVADDRFTPAVQGYALNVDATSTNNSINLSVQNQRLGIVNGAIDATTTITINGALEYGAAPALIAPPASVLHPGSAPWTAANLALFTRFTLATGGFYRYVNWQVGTASGNVQVGIVKLSGAGHTTWTRIADSGVIPSPGAGNARTDLGAVHLSPGDYALFLWADNTTFATRVLSNTGMGALRYAGQATVVGGVGTTGTLAWGQAGAELVLEGNF